MNKQRGHLEGLDSMLAAMALLSACGVLGIAAGIYWGLPALWYWAKPIIHSLTA